MLGTVPGAQDMGGQLQQALFFWSSDFLRVFKGQGKSSQSHGSRKSG